MLLRPRQTEFVDRAVAALRERGNTLAVAPTGFGKTIALAAIIGRLLAGGGRALVLQHRQELVSQNVAKFQIVNPALSVSVVDAGAKDFSGRAVFAMVPTLARPRTLHMLPAVDVVVIDEAHHAAAKTYRRIIDRTRVLNPAVMILGLTWPQVRQGGRLPGQGPRRSAELLRFSRRALEAHQNHEPH